jgi:hypothetical protein
MEKGADRRRENLPVADEIALLIPGEEDRPGSREVILWRNGLNHQITRNEEWHDDMHMYGSQLPRRLLPKGTTHRSAHRPTPPLRAYIHACRR